MAWTLDARIPLVTVADAAGLARELASGEPTAVLAEGELPEAPAAVAVARFDATARSQALACTSCNGRGAAAQALDRLFQARVRGSCGWFKRVVVLAGTPGGRAELEATLREDALTAARFRAA